MSLRPAEREARRRALDAVVRMRGEGLSLTRAAARAGTTVAAVKRHAGPALEKQPGGRYRATPHDRLARRLEFLTPTGRIQLDVKDSRSASKVAAHAAAVDRYLKTGDDRALRRFRGRGVTVGKAHPVRKFTKRG